MGLLKRIFNFGRSEANALLDKFEDKIKLLKLKVSDMKTMLDKSVEGLAKVKAIEIRQRSEAANLEEKANSYLDKAKKLKRMVKNGTVGEKQGKADILTLLNNHENLMKESAAMVKQADSQKVIVDSLAAKVKKLKTAISETTTKVTTLEAQRDAAKANKEIAKELSSLNFDGVFAEVQALEDQIKADNSEAEAWEGIEDSTQTDEERINKLLETSSDTDNNKLLNDFLAED